jgi:hypothetical protein
MKILKFNEGFFEKYDVDITEKKIRMDLLDIQMMIDLK